MTVDTSTAINAYNSAQTAKASKADNSTDKKLRAQTDAFESLLVKQMLDESVKLESPLFPKSAGSDIYKSMYTDTISHSVAGGFGFSKMLFNFLKERG